MNALVTLIDLGLGFLIYLIIVWAVLGWLVMFNIVSGYHPIVQSFMISVGQLLAPLRRPIRRVLPVMSGIDFSPVILMILIWGLRALLLNDILYPMMARGG